jgi:hypothetical protein
MVLHSVMLLGGYDIYISTNFDSSSNTSASFGFSDVNQNNS